MRASAGKLFAALQSSGKSLTKERAKVAELDAEKLALAQQLRVERVRAEKAEGLLSQERKAKEAAEEQLQVEKARADAAEAGQATLQQRLDGA